MKQTITLFPDKKICFLVCSNEKQNKNLFNEVNCFWGTGHFIEDMYSLAKCDYIIGHPSTYTMWASSYGKVPLYMIHDINYVFTLSDFKVQPSE